jgi:energy-coupling factor transporter ATP-binding protein EcfA2
MSLQEPVMFKGTLRTNLDPFHKYSDSDLVSVLKRCLLESLVDPHMHDMGLSHPVDVFGVNFSLGQQQLICLARAMLTPSKLLLLDEATASLDSDTDAKVQKVLRSNFSDRTIMTIAHRLDTIIDSDKILTMDAGKVAEFDSPQALLSNPKSIFTELCKNSGEDEYQRLLQAANSKGVTNSFSPQPQQFVPGQQQHVPLGMVPNSFPPSLQSSMQAPQQQYHQGYAGPQAFGAPQGFPGPMPQQFPMQQQQGPGPMQQFPMQQSPGPMHQFPMQQQGPMYPSQPLLVYAGQPLVNQHMMMQGLV